MIEHHKDCETNGGSDKCDCVPRTVPPTDAVPVFMSRDPAVRKRIPVATGFLKYFTDAIKCVSIVSRVGNEQHNPGQPLHWAKEKSRDEEDAGARHTLDALSGEEQDPALAELDDLGHLSQRAWRAMAALQRACDAKRAAYLARVAHVEVGK
jgi:hypothetical protein